MRRQGDRRVAATQAHGVHRHRRCRAQCGPSRRLRQPGRPSAPRRRARQSTTRRSAYVGASDFSSDWGDQPPMDLIEHEIGHALGWPHSGYDEIAAASRRSSALDVMSNSAAPRVVDPTAAMHPTRWPSTGCSAGWLPTSAVAVVPPTGATVDAGALERHDRARVLAVVALDDHTLPHGRVVDQRGLRRSSAGERCRRAPDRQAVEPRRERRHHSSA